MIYDLALLDVRTRTTAAALPRLARWLREEGHAGTLYACWYSEIGPINRILLMRGFDTIDAVHAERERVVTGADPFGIGEFLTGFASDTFLQCPGAPAPSTEVRGPWFEVRDYTMTPGGLTPLVNLWQPLLPARLRLAPMLTVLYAISGRLPRFVHLYPWPSLEERVRVRNEARSIGWPPVGAHQHVAAQEVTIYLAADFSPVH